MGKVVMGRAGGLRRRLRLRLRSGFAVGVPPEGGTTNGFPPEGGTTNGFPPEGGTTNGFPPEGGTTNGFPPEGGTTNNERLTGPPERGRVGCCFAVRRHRANHDCRTDTPDKPEDRSRWRGRGYYYRRGGSAVGLPVPYRGNGSPEAKTASGLFLLVGWEKTFRRPGT
jgi:hypothetical protein